MTDREDSGKPDLKKTYNAPKLVRYGTINEITGAMKKGNPDGVFKKKKEGKRNP